MTSKDNIDKAELQLRQLALVDRIIGLEAQVAHLKSSTGSEVAQRQIEEFTSSTTWRVGRIVLSPLLAIKSVFDRDKKK